MGERFRRPSSLVYRPSSAGRVLRHLLLALLALAVLGCAPAGAGPEGAAPASGGTPARPGPVIVPTSDDDLPIFDTHIHYSPDAWSVYPPEEALAILDRAGVRRALVSSTPDDGTILLYERAPDRIIPILRPYRTRADMMTWTRDPTVLAYVEERLAQGGYRGIGEFHLGRGEATAPVPGGFLALAAAHDLVLHAHADEVAVEELAALRPDVKVLWAHAGMGATAATAGSLLDRHPNLWVELALRGDVAPGGVLDSEWAALFRRHADRIMIGTDTWITPQWTRLPDLMDAVRAWLRQLPRDVAEQIAFRNAERLFGGS